MFACVPHEPLNEVQPIKRILIDDGVPEVGAFPQESHSESRGGRALATDQWSNPLPNTVAGIKQHGRPALDSKKVYASPIEDL